MCAVLIILIYCNLFLTSGMDSSLPARKLLSLWRVYLMCLLIRLKLQFLIQVLALGFSPLR